MAIPSVGTDMESLDLLYILNGSVKCHDNFGKHFSNLLKCSIYTSQSHRYLLKRNESIPYKDWSRTVTAALFVIRNIWKLNQMSINRWLYWYTLQCEWISKKKLHWVEETREKTIYWMISFRRTTRKCKRTHKNKK